MRHSRPHLTWVKRALVASATALGLAAGLSALPVAMAAPAHAADTFQSVTVTHTGTAPTGYTVTFKYQAPAGTQAVSIYGEWAYGTPNRGKTALGAEHTTASWADGDVPYGDPWDLGYQDMTVGPDNVWSITLPLPGGTFSYGFYVGCTAAQAKDGTQAGCTKADRVSDPDNVPWSNEPAQVAAGAAQQTMSQVYVPEDPSFDTGEDTTYQQASDSVAHGTLQEVTYAAPDSVNPAGEHRMVVYLPPNYSASGTAYPTLYISHGGGGNETDWVTQGSANIIMDNAIAAGKATPAVMVFTNFNDLATSDTLSSTNAYRQHLINTVIPYVEAHYNVSKDASERAFAGLSAGGSRANNILQNSADEFGYYGVWSINSRDAVTDEAAAKLAGVKAIQFGCGLEDMACGATGNNHAAYQTAQAINYRAAVPGLATVEDHVDATHSWYLWRHLLNNFVRTVAFKDISVTGTAPTATVNPGVATRLTATVGAADVALGGTVAFYAGDPNQNGTKLGSADVDASGEAAVTASFRETGSMGVYAQFTPANGQLPVTVKLYDVNVVQPTGAIVSYTGKAPTGYQVTFRYQGGSDVSAVSVSGEWAYEPIAADGASLMSPSHGPADWQAGDVLSGNQSVSMVKGNDGVWQVTMPMTAGEHSYSFSVTHQDGTRETVADPANLPWSNQAAQVQAGASQQTLSQFYVPNDTAYPTYDRDFEAPVPASEAGTLEEFSYASTEDADGTRDATVWLPPSYDADASTPYPTLYLSHGSNGSETDWATQGDAVNIIARAIADQKMQPTVVVMTNGNDELMDFDLYAANLKDSLIPAVEANFNVSKDVSERAYGGLSAGGRRGIVLLENYTDLFSYYGIWSAYTTYTDPTADQAAAMDKVDAVHIGAGIEDTSFGGINVTSHKRATGYAAAGVAVDEHNVDGVHSWDVWRQELNDYVRNVAFKGRYSAPVNPLKLGPTITKTDQGPTGYQVTFRFQAPAGTSGPVSIYGEWGLSTPVVAADGTRTFTSTHNPAEWKAGDGYNFGVTNNMTLTSDNVWEWTTPLPSGTFSYRYNYNCHATSITYNGQTYTYQSCDQTTDPYNVPWSNQPAQAAAGATPQAMSQIYVPESSDYPTVDNSFQAPVPTSDAGTLISLSYNSLADKATGETHQATVYLPKGYNASRATPYPTLYISHGAGGSDTDWVTQGQIQNIVQNAIDQHAADPMVVVVPNFETWLGWNQDEIADELQNYLIPVIEHNYNVSTNPAERAFAGLSMGGLTTVHLLENNTALFGYYGAMSQAAGVHTTLTDTQIAAMKQVKGLMMGVGYEDTVTPYANTVDRVNYYRSLGLQVTTDYMDGVHCWDVWRHLADYFIRNIAFKP
ncbi:MAG: hypothetical protein LBM66_00045, partial [Bifidobacteriaceae bacterium]|nr:hypothetical protein [Bifidobacteriaceae bacterium]